jgi:hypothetical protein
VPPRDRGRIVLALGEATGHAHAIADPQAALVETELEERFLHVLAEGGVLLCHEEHASVRLPQGPTRCAGSGSTSWILADGGRLMAGGDEGLTAEQRALAQVVSQEWVGHGLALQPADRATAEAGVGLVYRAAGLPPPRRVVWAGSPLAGAVAALTLTARSDPGLWSRRRWGSNCGWAGGRDRDAHRQSGLGAPGT